MGKSLKSVSLLPLLIFTEVSGLNIRNKLLGTCLQVHDGSPGVRVSLGQCDPHSAFQKWLWLPESKSLRNQYTGECLTAPEEQFEGVHLQPCHFQNEEAGGQLAHVSEMSGDAASQQWSCSKKGHLTLLGKGLHLSATQESTLVFLSREHKQGSRWRTLDNQTLLCGGRETKHHHQNHQAHHPLGKSMEPILLPSAISDMDRKAVEATFRDGVTEEFVVRDVSDVFPQSTKSPEDPTMVFFTMDYGTNHCFKHFKGFLLVSFEESKRLIQLSTLNLAPRGILSFSPQDGAIAKKIKRIFPACACPELEYPIRAPEFFDNSFLN